MTTLDAALAYIAKGWAPVPVPLRKKSPLVEDWQSLRISAETAPRYFNGAPRNIGVILGETSGGLCDIDLDCVEATRAAPFLLPPTAVFGHAPSKRTSHYVYQTNLSATQERGVQKFIGSDKHGLLELRTGAGGRAAQTVFPPSVHVSGEPIEWEGGGPGKIAEVDGDELLKHTRRLAAATELARNYPRVGARHEGAHVLGGFLGRCGFSPAEAALFAEAVAAASDQPGDKRSDMKRTARDGAQAEKRAGFPLLAETFGEMTAKKVASWLDYQGGDERAALLGFKTTNRERSEGNAAAREADAIPLVTEDSAALEFAQLYRGKLLYDHNVGAWHEWTGSHWRRETTGLAFEWARQLARRLSAGKKAGTRKALCKTTFAAGVERFARVDRAFAVTASYWDRDPFLLGTPRGTIDLRTGALRAAAPADAISRLTAVAPAETPDCPRFMSFLREATGDDDALIRFLRQFFGYCLCGSTREHALLFIHGSGGNGKSVLLNTVSWIMAEYSTTAAMDAFIATRGEKHSTDIAMLHGARLVTASEIARGRAWNENLIKALTGGDPITARFMRMDNFTFTPTFKLVVIGNHKPRLRSVNEAARRRFNIVPLDRTPVNPDPQLEEKLRAEAPGIMRWMIDGCLDWQKSNVLVRPRSVIEATEEYFATQDLFAQWLEDECDLEPGNRWKSAKSGELFASWSAYAKRAGEEAGTKVSFADELKEREIVPEKGTGGVRLYRGIRLKVASSGE